jgi:hypothetical protein
MRVEERAGDRDDDAEPDLLRLQANRLPAEEKRERETPGHRDLGIKLPVEARELAVLADHVADQPAE